MNRGTGKSTFCDCDCAGDLAGEPTAAGREVSVLQLVGCSGGSRISERGGGNPPL